MSDTTKQLKIALETPGLTDEEIKERRYSAGAKMLAIMNGQADAISERRE